MTAGSEVSSAAAARRRARWVALVFLAPALVILGALVVYPIFYTLLRSFYDRAGDTFVGGRNYKDMLTSSSTLTAIKNNIIWVIVAPSAITALGLVFAVMVERVKWSTAFKVAVFMPMAISFLSTGVIWRLVYDANPQIGLANALLQGTVDVFRPPGPYPGARPSDTTLLEPRGKGYASGTSFSPGQAAQLGLVAIPPDMIPAEAEPARVPAPGGPDTITGAVWLDFTAGGGGEKGVVDPTEKGLPGVTVQAVSGGDVVGSATSGPDGSFALTGLSAGTYSLALPDSDFREPYGGIDWLGPLLVTPSIIVAYIWIWAGFAMIVIGAGLAAIPREVLEASRVDGANEWWVFRRVTVPLLAPVIAVVFVTLVINVLKIFDLVLVLAPGSVQDNANVIALEMWRQSFGSAQNQGLGSALAIFLFILVLPAMAFNIRRFRREA